MDLLLSCFHVILFLRGCTVRATLDFRCRYLNARTLMEIKGIPMNLELTLLN